MKYPLPPGPGAKLRNGATVQAIKTYNRCATPGACYEYLVLAITAEGEMATWFYNAESGATVFGRYFATEREAYQDFCTRGQTGTYLKGGT